MDKLTFKFSVIVVAWLVHSCTGSAPIIGLISEELFCPFRFSKCAQNSNSIKPRVSDIRTGYSFMNEFAKYSLSYLFMSAGSDKTEEVLPKKHFIDY